MQSRYLQIEVRDASPGSTLHWYLDRERLREDDAYDGLYCLLTNRPVAVSRLEVLRRYKAQSNVE